MRRQSAPAATATTDACRAVALAKAGRSCLPNAKRAEQKQNRRHLRSWNLLRDVPIPRERHDLHSARAKKVMRIKGLRGAPGMPIPENRRHDRNCEKCEQL